MKNLVSLHYCEDYSTKNVKDCLESCLEDLGGLNSLIKSKSKVLLKCHLSNNEPNRAKTTHPSVVVAIAEKLAKLGASCIIADCPEESGDINKIYETTQMLYASNQGNAELNLNDLVKQVEIDGVMTKKLTLLSLVDDVDYIVNIPKLILDKNFAVKGSTDNLFGLIPSEMQEILRGRLVLPKDYNNYLLDILSTIQDKLVLNILEGIVASEMDGTQRIMNAIAVSQDSVCLDECAYNICGLNRKDYSLFVEAEKRNLFAPAKIVGDKPIRFAKDNLDTPAPDPNGEMTDIKKSKRKQLYNSTQARPKVDVTKCKGCKRCFASCPVEAIEEGRDVYNEIYAKINREKCINCMRCVRACPYQAINVVIPSKYKTMQSKIDKRMATDKE